MSKRIRVWTAIISGLIFLFITIRQLMYLGGWGFLAYASKYMFNFDIVLGMPIGKLNLSNFPLWILGRHQYFSLITIILVVEFIPCILLLIWGLRQIKIEDA